MLMSFRRPSLRLFLLLVSLLTAAIGAALGLGVTYVQESENLRYEIERNLVHKVSDFARNIDTEYMLKLKNEDIGAHGQFKKALNTFQLSNGPGRKVRAQILNPSDQGSVSLAFFVGTPGYKGKEIAFLTEHHRKALAGTSALVGYPENNPFALMNLVKQFRGKADVPEIEFCTALNFDDVPTHLLVVNSIEAPSYFSGMSVLKRRHLLPLLGIVPLLVTLMAVGFWITARLKDLSKGMKTVTEGRFDYRFLRKWTSRNRYCAVEFQQDGGKSSSDDGSISEFD